MMGSISVREHIRWGQDAPSEPTSTLVLTSPGRHFVDIRILKTALPSADSTTAPSEASKSLPRSSLDWAFGGTSSSTPITHQDGNTVSHAVFRHWVDSRTLEPEQIVDEGDMFPYPGDNSLTIETGQMTNPDTGVETDYEELWRDQEPRTGKHDVARCLVFQLHDDTTRKRGLVVRLGKHAQGVLRVGEVFTAERWAWDGDKGKWERLFKAGDEGTGSLDTIILEELEESHRVGDSFDAAGGKWTVVEASN